MPDAEQSLEYLEFWREIVALREKIRMIDHIEKNLVAMLDDEWF